MNTRLMMFPLLQSLLLSLAYANHRGEVVLEEVGGLRADCRGGARVGGYPRPMDLVAGGARFSDEDWAPREMHWVMNEDGTRATGVAPALDEHCPGAAGGHTNYGCREYAPTLAMPSIPKWLLDYVTPVI